MAYLCDYVRIRLGTPLAERLSLFWSSWDALRLGSRVGRFPLADRLDLVLKGICLHGVDERDKVAFPEPGAMRCALVVESARFLLDKLATPERDRLLRDPKGLVSLGCREVTKAVLFPVRFLYTAETGKVANNPQAVDWFSARPAGPTRALVLAASAWRERGTVDGTDRTIAALREGLLPLYESLAARYRDLLHEFGEGQLAAGIEAWRARLKSTANVVQ
jgi:hypothetical protein